MYYGGQLFNQYSATKEGELPTSIPTYGGGAKYPSAPAPPPAPMPAPRYGQPGPDGKIMLPPPTPGYAAGSGQPLGGASGSMGVQTTQFGQNPYNSGVPLSNTFVAQTPISNMQFHAGQYQGGLAQGGQDLSMLSNMLQEQARGGGPNIAEQQLRQGTERNIASAYALGQSSPNNAGTARNIANNVAAANQQGAADAATMRMQQQLAAEGQLGQLGLGMYGTSGRLLSDAQKMQLMQAQGNQAAALNAQGINAQTSAGNQQYGANVIGAAGDAAGAAAALAAGAAGSYLSNRNSGSPQTSGGGDSGGDVTPATPMTDTSTAGDYNGDTSGTYYGATGGLVPYRHYDDGGYVPPNASPADFSDYSGKSAVSDLRSPDLLGARGTTLNPYHQVDFSKVRQPQQSDISKGAGKFVKTVSSALPIIGPAYASLMALGGNVPGHAMTGGNNLKNDTVPAMLSPGEIVLPRSVTQDEDAAEKAADFVRAIQRRKMKAA